MKKILFLGGLFALLLFVIAPLGCYYDNEEDLYGNINTPCDTVNIRYSVQITQLMEKNCYSCHKSGNPAFSGIILTDYNALKSYATFGQLLERINSNDATKVMPQTGKLPDCERAVIEAWVKAGAPNN